MIYFIDFDGTLFETKNRIIPDYIPNEKAIELLNNSYIVSGNLKSKIIETLNFFLIEHNPKHIIGYLRGMPMDNLKRKIAVIKRAIKQFNLEDRLNEITYIGDEEDDEFACIYCGINFIYVSEIEREIRRKQFIENVRVS